MIMLRSVLMLFIMYSSHIAMQIFEDGKLSHFVDGRGAAGNWMAYVNGARYAQEQNLTAIQVYVRLLIEILVSIMCLVQYMNRGFYMYVLYCYAMNTSR